MSFISSTSLNSGKNSIINEELYNSNTYNSISYLSSKKDTESYFGETDLEWCESSITSLENSIFLLNQTLDSDFNELSKRQLAISQLKDEVQALRATQINV